VTYWIFVVAVLVFGFVTGFSIGAFIMPVGLALLILGLVRHRRRLFWPILLAVVGFQVGYVLFVPLSCTATGTLGQPSVELVCNSVLGGEFRAAGIVDPPRTMAIVAGVLAAGGSAVLAYAAVVVVARQSD
jgi:hypothetical protein